MVCSTAGEDVVVGRLHLVEDAAVEPVGGAHAGLGGGFEQGDAGGGERVMASRAAHLVRWLALIELARARNVDMPIADCVERLIAGSLDVDAAVGELLARPPKGEE